jgi:hypothetical protein
VIKLNDYEKFNLTRGCLVRSKPISPGAATTQQALIDFLNNKGEWVLMMKEHIKPLLAVWFLQSNLEDYRIEPSDFANFLKENRIIIDNPLIHEILSKRTGKPPKVAEDLVPSIPMVANAPLNSLEIPELIALPC